MPRLSKYQKKVQEAIYRFVVVPFLFVIGVYMVSVTISSLAGLGG